MTAPEPSLKSLIAFEATVRLGSMSAAGRELGTTQPAVSQRIRYLEEALGIVLFERSRQRLRPTRDGQLYYDEIAEALRRVTGATQRLRSRANSRGHGLTIAAHFGFAHMWLLPRLQRLESAFPGTGFEVLPVNRTADEEAPAADVEIRFREFDAIGMHEWPLLAEAVFPVCSPGFAREHGLRSRSGVEPLAAGVPLLHMDSCDPRWLDWVQWCRLAGAQAPSRPARFHYRNYPLLLHAAIEGQGLALGWRGLVDGAIAEGTLVALGPVVERPDRGYILSTPYGDRALVRALVDWFLREFAEDAPTDAAAYSVATPQVR